jgi:DNA-binding transcriptional ArsR family regulator
MEESRYRESRLCRLLGNPVVYQVVVLLESSGPLTPSKLAELTDRSVATISIHLAKLRTADVVRYDTRRKQTRYWLKHKREMKDLLNTLKKVIGASAPVQ